MLLSSLSLGLLCVILMAILLDLVVGDPKRLPHPVQLIGAFIIRLDARWNRGDHRTQRINGFLLTASVVMSTFAITYAA
ncbi:cobalamin biosynthesis protein [Nitrincola nitratireducens]|uniref:Cobalamin biosynthesis protein n=2 Tax=Nitrincola nitratireducens TaxID=1229521 RepID=W9V0R9_9GAMM|nr:cobalamin biosynthesis protein [Nitrincola nitratireducens]